MKTRNSILALSAMALVLVALACGAPTAVAPTVPAAQEAGQVTPTNAPAQEATPPEVTTAAGCALGSQWVADVTVPDSTEIAPGVPFNKTWRVRNSGTCAWEAGTSLVFISGERMGGPDSVPVGAVTVGATTDVNVNLAAPASPGTYRGNWQMQAPDGTRFGSILWVQIVVPAPPTETAVPPTAEPTTAPTAEASPTTGSHITPIRTIHFVLLPNFEATYVGSQVCGLGRFAMLRAENTGRATLEWETYTIQDLATSEIRTSPGIGNPFLPSGTACPPGADSLPVNGVAYLALNISGMTSGHVARATIRLYVKEGGGESYAEKTVDFTIP